AAGTSSFSFVGSVPGCRDYHGRRPPAVLRSKPVPNEMFHSKGRLVRAKRDTDIRSGWHRAGHGLGVSEATTDGSSRRQQFIALPSPYSKLAMADRCFARTCTEAQNGRLSLTEHACIRALIHRSTSPAFLLRSSCSRAPRRAGDARRSSAA